MRMARASRWHAFKSTVLGWTDTLPILHPDSTPKLTWDLFLLALVMWNAFVVPIDVSYGLPNWPALLEHVAGSVKPGGRLVYAVCTVTRAETSAIADAFTAAHPEFTPAEVLASSATPPSPQLLLWPHELNANGMFIAGWRRR